MHHMAAQGQGIQVRGFEGDDHAALCRGIVFLSHVLGFLIHFNAVEGIKGFGILLRVRVFHRKGRYGPAALVNGGVLGAGGVVILAVGYHLLDIHPLLIVHRRKDGGDVGGGCFAVARHDGQGVVDGDIIFRIDTVAFHRFAARGGQGAGAVDGDIVRMDAAAFKFPWRISPLASPPVASRVPLTVTLPVA